MCLPFVISIIIVALFSHMNIMYKYIKARIKGTLYEHNARPYKHTNKPTPNPNAAVVFYTVCVILFCPFQLFCKYHLLVCCDVCTYSIINGLDRRPTFLC